MNTIKYTLGVIYIGFNATVDESKFSFYSDSSHIGENLEHDY